MLLAQILSVVIFVGIIVLVVLAFIEPGPLNRRSRNKRGQRPDRLPEADAPTDDASPQ